METSHDWWYNVMLVIKLQFLYNSRRKERSSKKKFALRFVLWVSQKRLQYSLLYLLFSMQCWDFWFHVLLSHQWVVIICWWSVGVGIRWWSLGVGRGGGSIEGEVTWSASESAKPMMNCRGTEPFKISPALKHSL